MVALAEKEDWQYTSIDDVIEILSRKDKSKRPPAFTWDRLPQCASGDFI